MEETRCPAVQFVINAAVDVVCRRDRKDQRLLSGSERGGHDGVLPVPVLADPAGDFVAYGQMRVVAVTLLFTERHLLDGRVRAFNVDVHLPLLRDLHQIRLLAYGLPKVIEYDICLVKLRG